MGSNLSETRLPTYIFYIKISNLEFKRIWLSELNLVLVILTLAERASAPRMTPPSYLMAMMVVYIKLLNHAWAYTISHVRYCRSSFLGKQLLLKLGETHHFFNYLLKIIKLTFNHLIKKYDHLTIMGL